MGGDFADAVAREREPAERPSSARGPAVAGRGRAAPAPAAGATGPVAAGDAGLRPAVETDAAETAPGQEAPCGPKDDPYLAPAMRAAAAAKARAARIRSGEHVPGEPAPAAPSRAHWVAPATAPAVRPPGLSVAEAASASPIAFRPLRQIPGETPYVTEYRPFAAPEPAPAPEPVAPPPPPADAPESRETGSSAARRFGKTVAELERRHCAAAASEPWAQMVPRPAGRRPDETAAEVGGGVRPKSLGLLWRYVRRADSGSGSAG